MKRNPLEGGTFICKLVEGNKASGRYKLWISCPPIDDKKGRKQIHRIVEAYARLWDMYQTLDRMINSEVYKADELFEFVCKRWTGEDMPRHLSTNNIRGYALTVLLPLVADMLESMYFSLLLHYKRFFEVWWNPDKIPERGYNYLKYHMKEQVGVWGPYVAAHKIMYPELHKNEYSWPKIPKLVTSGAFGYTY